MVKVQVFQYCYHPGTRVSASVIVSLIPEPLTHSPSFPRLQSGSHRKQNLKQQLMLLHPGRKIPLLSQGASSLRVGGLGRSQSPSSPVPLRELGPSRNSINPFTPKRDQLQISPAASPNISHHTVWRTWLFIRYSDERFIMVPILTKLNL